MALTKQLTPLRPVKSSRNILTVGYNLVVFDNLVEVINVNCTSTVAMGVNIDNALADARKEGQEHINNYLDEAARNDSEYTEKVNAIDDLLNLEGTERAEK